MTALLAFALFVAQDLKKPVSLPDHAPLLREAIALHDRGEYAAAAAKYGEILAANPDDAAALYELGFTQFARQDYDACITSSRRGLRYDWPQRVRFFSNLGNCLDGAKRSTESVATYREGIAAYPEDALLRFNLGVTLHGQQDWAGARTAFQQSIERNPRHASSHLNLADVYGRSGYRVPALLAATYFLVLEPDTRRAPSAVGFIQRLIQSSVTRQGSNTTMTLNVNAAKDEGDFQPAEMGLMIAAAAATTEKKKTQSPRENLLSTYRILAEMAARPQAVKGFAADFYLPFLRELGERHLEAFTARMLASSDEEARRWAEKNKSALQAYEEWRQAKATR